MSELAILIVDDDPNILATLGDVLKDNHWHVDLADNGTKAVSMVKEKHYDMVLLDVNMPGLDGVQTMMQIKNVRPETLVFLMTGGSLDRIRQLQDNLIPTVLQKPIDAARIVAMVTDLEKKGQVLVVDDDVNDRTLLADLLVESGYRVKAAKNGEEGVALAAANDFSVALIDMKLPDMSGTEVMEKIKKIQPGIFVIVISGYSLDAIMDEVIKKGAYSCFVKPFNVEMLLKEIESVMHKSEEHGSDSALNVKPRILLVDDEENIRETMADIVRENNYIVDTASSVEKALELIAKYTYNVVVSDLKMGNRQGLELVDPVHERNPGTGFLLMTGQGTMETALEAIKKGVNEYLLKPLQPADLLHKLEVLLETQQLQMEKDMLMKEVMESNVKLQEITRTDELTQVLSRRCLFEVLYGELQRAKRQKTMLSLFMCDVDGFKRYNDTFGHVEGDKLLRTIADILKTTVRQFLDQVFRYGGDEFAIVLPGVDEPIARDVAGRILKNVVDKVGQFNVGISIGGVCYCGSQAEINVNELIDIADKKLYEGKKAGKGRFVI
jgi:two-component system cell cycle response regulator